MNPLLVSQLAACQARDLTRRGERHQHHPQHRQPAAGGGRQRRSSLRRRMGLTLVEAGLALLATSTAD